MARELIIPRPGWKLRPYQQDAWRASAVEGKNMALAWHRRAGKDELLLNALAVQALKRPASYMYMFPENSHARRSMWDAVNPHTGKKRVLETFGGILAKDPNNTDMKLDLVNGSNITFFGSDNYDRAVGAGLAGIVSSEHALAHPNAYAFFSPMLRENGGWFWAISTPRGRNHFKQLIEYAQKSDKWFSQILSIDDTGALSPEIIQEALEEYIGLYGEDEGLAYFNQEYRVDFTAAVMGAFFAREMSAVRSEGRVDPNLDAVNGPVHRAWDLGMRDDTTIWFWQVVGGQVYILDVYSTSGVALDAYASHIEKIYEERKWQHGIDFVPHDAKVKELGTGRTRVETMQSLGLQPRLVPNAGLMDGINAARQTLPRCVFHARCEHGIQALELYRREYNEETKVYRSNPLHDWTSHYADSFRYMSLAWREIKPEIAKPAPAVIPYTVNEILPPPIDHRRWR